MADWKVQRGRNGLYWLHAKDLRPMKAIIGKAGLIANAAKREGDMATPIGRWALRHVYYRKDLLGHLVCALPTSEITPLCGWCDDSTHQNYNCHVDLPFSASHELMWRDDGAYDLVIMLGFNDAPSVAGRGSAIFLHCIASGRTHTAGCVALTRIDLINLINYATYDQHLYIDAQLPI